MVSAGEMPGRVFLERLKALVWPPWVSSASVTESARLTQAKLFVEVARRVDRPLDILPSGEVSLVSAVLWQRAAAWAIAAAEESLSGGVASAETRDVLTRVAGGSEPLGAVEAMLQVDVGSAKASPAAAALAATTLASFTERLIEELERPAREAARHRAVRGTVVLVAAIAVALVALWIAWRTRPSDLVPSASRTQSSQMYACTSGECGNSVFHTNLEPDPWVQYDFGSQKRLHSISVTNRTDCCYERAVPLVVESSNDGRRWKEQVRTDEQFMAWSGKLRGSARFVRLRVARTSYLHLSSVVIR
jgi:hypothetical protein